MYIGYNKGREGMVVVNGGISAIFIIIREGEGDSPACFFRAIVAYRITR